MTEIPDVPPKRLPWRGTALGALALAGLAGLAVLVFASWAERSAESARARTERLASDIAQRLDGDGLARADAAAERAPEAAVARDDGLARALAEAAEQEGVALRVLRLEARAQPRIEAARSAEAAGVLEVLASSAEHVDAARADYASAMAPAFFERASSSTRHGGSFASVVEGFAPIADSFGATVAVLELRQSSWAGLLPRLLAWAAGFVALGLLALAVRRSLAADQGLLRKVLEDRRLAASLERRARRRPRNLATKLEDARHTFDRLLDKADLGGLEHTVQGPLHAALRAVQRAADLRQVRITSVVADGLRGRPLARPHLVFAALAPLLDNAVHKTPRGGSVSIRARLEPGNGDLRFDVADSGVGMSFREQDELRPLTRSVRPAPAATAGLDVARSAATIFGGAIGFESQPGQGTRFWLVVPAAEAFGLRAAA
ncbi:MAG TPA: ATP-binding protein [Planctomycetota bacterium]